MSFTSRIRAAAKGLFGISFGTSGADTWQYAQDWARGLPLESDGKRVTFPYSQHPTVGLAISTIAEDAAAVPWELYAAAETEEDEERIENHPLLTLWDKPNQWMCSGDLWIASYTYFKLYGEAWWWYPNLSVGLSNGPLASRRNTGEIWLIHPQRIRVKLSGDTRQFFLIEDGTAKETELDPDTLTGFLRFDPERPSRGLSPLTGVQNDMDADHAAAVWNRDVLGEQSGVPVGIMKPPKDAIAATNAKDREELEKRWGSQHKGRRGIGVVPPGWDWQAMSISPREMDYKTLREYSRENILASAGPLPPFLAGVLDKANYANAREQKDVYWHGTLTRMLTYFQWKINGDFLPKVGVTDVKAYPCWEVVKALTENLAEKVEVGTKLFAMGFTKRQINERLELGFDVDELTDADVGYVPFSVTPVSEAGAQPEPAIAEPTRELHLVENDASSRERRRVRLWNSVISRTRDMERRFDGVIRRHMQLIRAEVLGNIDGIKGWMATRKAVSPDQLLFNTEKSKSKLRELAQRYFREAIRRGAEGVLSDLDAALNFNILDIRVVGKLAEMTYKIARIDETIERDLRASLVEGVGGGESPQQLAARVRQVMDASLSRSSTIARTEIGTAYSTGRNEGMRQAGVERHEWLSAKDANVREDHQAEDGNVVFLGQQFPVTHMLYPLDPSGPPEQIINCRCVAIPYIKEA